jgi:hypothetical protein
MKTIDFIIKARVIGEKIGYPDNLDNDNLTTLEKDYAGVRQNK